MNLHSSDFSGHAGAISVVAIKSFAEEKPAKFISPKNTHLIDLNYHGYNDYNFFQVEFYAICESKR